MAEAFITRRGGGTVVEDGTITPSEGKTSITIDALKGKKRFMLSLHGAASLPNHNYCISLYFDDGYAYVLYKKNDSEDMYFVGGSDYVSFDSASGKITPHYTTSSASHLYFAVARYRYWIFE